MAERHADLREQKLNGMPVLRHMALYRFKGLVTDIMLDAAGILCRGLLIDTEIHEQGGEHRMPLIDPLGQDLAGLCQFQEFPVSFFRSPSSFSNPIARQTDGFEKFI